LRQLLEEKGNNRDHPVPEDTWAAAYQRNSDAMRFTNMIDVNYRSSV